MASLSKSQREFAERAYAAAYEAGLSGPQADLSVAQAVHETAWGSKPSGVNNFHGIKGPGSKVATHEIVGGKRVNIRDSFRNFPSMAGSFKAWGGLMGRRFKDVLDAPTVSEAVKGLRAGQIGGYATDPKYDSKVNSIARSISGLSPFSTASLPSIDRIATPVENPRSFAAPVDLVERSTLAPVEQTAFGQGGLLSPPDMSMVSSAQASPASMARVDPARFGSTTPATTSANTLRDQLQAQAASLPSQPGLSQPAYSQRAASLMPSRPAVSVPALASPATPYSPTPASYQQPAFSAAQPKIDAFGQPPAPGLQPAAPSQYTQTAAISAPRTIGTPSQIAAPVEDEVIDAPAANPALDQFPDKPSMGLFGGLLGQQSKQGLLGSLLGGVVGSAALGPLGGIAGGLLGRAAANKFGGGLLGSYNGPTQDIGSGMQAISSVMGGGLAPGSTASASNGQTVTSLPGGGYQRTSKKYGWTEITTADGRTTRAKSTRGAGGDYGGIRSEKARDAIDKGTAGLF